MKTETVISSESTKDLFQSPYRPDIFSAPYIMIREEILSIRAS